MPISFTSKSHGTIPIGFFNIETDLLLMDRIFFFSTDFCGWVMKWADAMDPSHDKQHVYLIRKDDAIGNLAGAIHGFDFTGFIGETYKVFPFPENRAGFKQKPYGMENRQTIETILRSFAVRLEIPIVFSRADKTIGFGDYMFSTEVFQEIVHYVEAGGMPGWLNGTAPDYVNRMTARVADARNWLFNN